MKEDIEIIMRKQDSENRLGRFEEEPNRVSQNEKHFY